MAVCLVIDDEALHREIDCFAMTLAGYDTCEAASAEDALTICLDQMPDVILLDLMMPGMNGLEFLVSLRAMKGGEKPFIMVCSAYGVSDAEEKARVAGANNFILKPFSSTMLKEKLSESGITSQLGL